MVRGLFVKTNVIVKDEKDASRIYNRGNFGTLKQEELHLGLVEALYLLEAGRIDEIYNYHKNKMDFEHFVRRATKTEKRFWTRYLVYKDIRGKGYITKTALKYGADFRVYEKGEESHAPWLLFAVNESEEFDWRKFAAMNRVAHSVKKKLMIGIVDDEDDVTYYEISWRKP